MKLCPRHIPQMAVKELIELTDETECEDCEIIRQFYARSLESAARKLALRSE